ncbi:MAG: histidine kinase [Clostridia bacterium]|nr:histidine kinase [Clostridia bacterium]
MKMSIKTKILLSTSLVIMVSLILSGTFAYYYFANILKEQAVKDDKVKLRQTARQLEYYSEDIIKFSQNIITDKDVQEYMRKDNTVEDPFAMLSAKSKVIERLKDYIALRGGYIHSAVLIKNDGSICFNLVPFSDDYMRNHLKEDWYPAYEDRKNNYYFSRPHHMDIRGVPADVISCIVTIQSVNQSDKVLGELILNLSMPYFIKYIDEASKGFDDFMWVNQENCIIYAKAGDKKYLDVKDIAAYVSGPPVQEPQLISKPDGYIVLDRSMDNGWKLVSFTSNKRLFQRIEYIFYFFVFFILASLIFIIAVIMPIILNITKPITKLTRKIKEVSGGNLDVEIQISSGDEVEALCTGFNKMIGDIKRHINESIEHEKVKRKMEFDIMLSQINPHFIYNVLNTIIYMARKEKNQNIAKVTDSLIRILQDGIKLGKSGLYTSIRQEMEIVNHYVEIQKFRYSEIFVLEWKVDESLLDCLIPKTLIQPLIENALFHGICPKDEKGTIIVSIFKDEKDIKIIIEDDGVGMDQDMIDSILIGEKHLNSGDSVRHIGISNIRDRLKYLYGEDYRLEIDSRPGEGTKITLKVPFVMGES